MGDAGSGFQAVPHSGSDISSSPRPQSALSTALLAILLSGTVLYGSLIPFRFSISRLDAAFLEANLLRIHSTTAEDLIVNLLVYSAFAASLVFFARANSVRAGFLIVALCGAVSTFAESLQALLPQRVSSATDVLLNITGAAFGVLAASVLQILHGPFSRSFARRARLRPMTTLTIAVSAGIMIYQLVPFDFISTTDELHDCFRRLVPIFQFQMGMSAILDELPIAAWFSFLGFLVARDLLEKKHTPLSAVRAALVHGLVLAIVIESLQLLTRSHVPEIFAATFRTLAALLGGWTAAFLLNPTPSGARSITSCFSLPLLLAAAAVELLVLALGLIPSGTEVLAGSNWFRLPFQSLWLAPLPLAGAKALSAVVTSGLLAATLAAALRRCGIPAFRVVSTLAVLGIHLVFQIPAMTCRSSPVDLTNTLLALLACGFALRLERWIAGLDRLAHETVRS